MNTMLQTAQATIREAAKAIGRDEQTIEAILETDGKLETIAREDVEAIKVSELSLMPEGIEKQLQPQEIADLFAFITLDKHPDDPAARRIPEK